MKFLLLALLSCICSADDRRSRAAKQWARRSEVSKLVESAGSRLPSTFNRHNADPASSSLMVTPDAVVRLRHYDDRAAVISSRRRVDEIALRHPIRHRRRQFRSMESNGHAISSWPVKKEAVVEGDLLLGGLMMVHEREDTVTCGPVMPQGGVQALEAMLYTLDILNEREIVPGVKIGAHILDDCDKDTYGLEMAVDFIKGTYTRRHTAARRASSLVTHYINCVGDKQIDAVSVHN